MKNHGIKTGIFKIMHPLSNFLNRGSNSKINPVVNSTDIIL